MAVGLIMNFPGVTQEQYDAVMEQLNLGGRMPPGGISHAAGPTDEGWRVVDVWESQQAFDTFLHERLYQAMQNAGIPRPQVDPRLIVGRFTVFLSLRCPDFLRIARIAS